MSGFGRIARRGFLIGSAAIAGGVAFGIWQVRRPAPNPLSPLGGATALTPFVVVARDGVSIVVPRAEMGQGVHTTLAALVAEELDIALADVSVIHGPPGRAYFNGALLEGALPFRDYEMSGFQHALASALGQAGKLFDMQVTGGSTSTVDGFERMRSAGASAREALKLAAADRLGVEVAALRTQGGRVIAPDGTARPYADLAEAAAQVDPPQPVLRPRSEWKILGTSQPRTDMVGKCTGTAEFGIDVRLPGMRFASVRMAPWPGGRVAELDDSPARDMPGVEKIVDLGDGVAVIATNTWLAMQALQAIRTTWAGAGLPDTEAAFDVIGEAFGTEANSALRDDGDADSLPEGATEVTAEYRLPYLAHATMEPMNATARLDGDALEVWCGNQAPLLIRGKLAEVMGLDPQSVTLHTPFMGGGFGRRAEADAAVLAARVARAMPGVAVQTTWSREEDMRHDFYRPGALARFRGAVRDGRAVLLDGRIAAQSCARQTTRRMTGFGGIGADKTLVEGAADQPYAIPNYRIRGYLAELPVPVGFWRSVGHSHNGFFHECFIDELAHAAGRDPLAFRLEMVRAEHAPSAGCLEAVRGMSGWDAPRSPGTGMGVAFTYSFGTPVAEVVEVVETDGTIRIARAWIACDVGTALDPSIIEAQMTSGLVYGLSAAVFGEIGFDAGAVIQGNFPDYDALRMHTAPKVIVKVLETNPRMGGVGEPGTPPSMPALANALFDLTGTRARRLPLIRDFPLLT